MTAAMEDHEREMPIADKPHAEVAEASPIVGAHREEPPAHRPMPWIGALPNPRIGPMVVINDSGYLMPLWTAGDLLRGCKYFWRAYQD